MDSKLIFANRLSTLRKENAMSLVKLGDLVGISNQAISLLEQAKRAPSFEVLIAVASVFDVSVDYLIGRTDKPDSHKR